VTSVVSSDRALVDAVLMGDRDSYRLLVERESHAVIELCTEVLGDPDEAHDAAQDAFVQALGSLAGYHADVSFGTWVKHIARRIAAQRAAAAPGGNPGAVKWAAERVPDGGADPLRHIVAHQGSQRTTRSRVLRGLARHRDQAKLLPNA
jgi:DNA-directed RNA polymerase specialized sigma24 family protein